MLSRRLLVLLVGTFTSFYHVVAMCLHSYSVCSLHAFHFGFKIVFLEVCSTVFGVDIFFYRYAR